MENQASQAKTAANTRPSINTGLVIFMLLTLFMGLLAWQVVSQTEQISAQYDKIEQSANSFEVADQPTN